MKRFILILLTCAMLVGCLTCFAACNKEPVELSREGVDKEIITSLCEYLGRKNAIIDTLNDGTLNYKIEHFDSESDQALHVAIDPNNYYYICGYYTSENNNNNYSNAWKYTWVKFTNKKDIKEYYGNDRLVVAFQINKAKFVRNIASPLSKTPKFEHFLLYTPKFENGVNVADKLYCDVSYINFSSKDFRMNSEYILDSTEERLYKMESLTCKKINGRYYILQETKVGYKERNLESAFGSYYDELMEIMITDKYSEKIDGKTYYYGLFNVNEFGRKILK